MSKMGEIGVDKFRHQNEIFDVSNLNNWMKKTVGTGGESDNHKFFNDNPDARLVKNGYDTSGYIRQSLNNKEKLGIGGVNSVNANSSPEELLKNPRVRAMLDVIGYAEGTGKNYGRVVYGTVLGPSDRNAPYDRSLVGKKNVVVDDFRHHPNLAVHWANGQPPSSASGRYQFLYSTWKGLGMKDFSPHSQDLAAIKLMQRRGMIEPLLRGDFTGAIRKGAPEWASLPVAGGGSYYGGQGAKNLGDLKNVFDASLKKYQETKPSTPKPPTNHPTPKPPVSNGGTLAKGQHGRAVEALQDKLIRFGVMTEAQKKTGPGIFGPRTEAAVKKFQKNAGLSQSGRYDHATTAAMNKLLSGDIKKGAKGEIVRNLQENLIKLGYMTRAQVNTGPGIFGPRTDAALRHFQTDHKLSRDGIFGPRTFSSIQKALANKTAPTPKPQQPSGGKVPTYKPWNVYSTGKGAARLSDGYEDLQPHHDYQSVNYVSRNVRLNHRLEARDVVLTRGGQSNFGQTVPSPLSGKVLYAGNEGDGYGNKVVIKNERTGQIIMIGHLESINVRRGQSVSYGQNLGGQGSTGHSTGAHVHINADPSVIKRWVADLADGKFDGVRLRFDIGRHP